jgi:hypothetical protein
LYLPPRSPLLMPIVVILFVCGFLSLLSVVVGVTRLACDRSTRLPRNIACVAIGVIPASLFLGWYALSLYG